MDTLLIALHHPDREKKLALTGVNARTDGYARLWPDGTERWPVFLERLRPLWVTELHFAREQLMRIGAPTLLGVGNRDIVTPEHAVEMFRTIPGAQLCVVPHARHGIVPKDTILAFLNETSAGAKQASTPCTASASPLSFAARMQRADGGATPRKPLRNLPSLRRWNTIQSLTCLQPYPISVHRG